MPSANNLIGDGLAYEVPTQAAPSQNGAAPVSMGGSDRNVANWLAFLVIAALGVLILIRLAGLQGMIAVGRS